MALEAKEWRRGFEQSPLVSGPAHCESGGQMNYSERMELRQKAVEKLADHGVWMARTSTMQQIAEQVEIVTGVKQRRSQMVSDYLYRWLDEKPEPVNPRSRPEFRPMRPVRHPRAD